MIEFVFDTVGRLLIFYLAVLLPAMLLLLLYSHLKIPKALKADLLRPPFFSEAELARLSAFPFSLMKTLAVVRAAAVPSTMVRRFGSYDYSEKVPVYFKITSCFLILLVLVGASICLMAALCGVLLEFS